MILTASGQKGADMIFLQPRTSVSVYVTLLVPLISVLATLIAGGLIFAALGYAPLPALYEFFIALYLVQISLEIFWSKPVR